MSTSMTMKQCRRCGKATMHVQPGTSHVLHLLLSLLTLGLWLPVWFLLAANSGTAAQCTQCGRAKGLLGIGK